MHFKISTDPAARLRIDKWLWAARFFKTRSLAGDALDKGRVRLAGQPVKAAKELRVGDIVRIDVGQTIWEVEVKGLCDVRGPASTAQTLYAETLSGRARREAELERRKLYREPAAILQGRPTKRDRRIIDKFSNAS